MSTCSRLDLQTLGSQPIIMPKISPITGYVGLNLGGGRTLLNLKLCIRMVYNLLQSKTYANKGDEVMCTRYINHSTFNLERNC